MALKQHNVKRMLAFSGISHAGFMLMALLSIKTVAANLFYYTAAYALAGIAAFAVIIYVSRSGKDENISSFNGLGKKNPLMAAVINSFITIYGRYTCICRFLCKIYVV